MNSKTAFLHHAVAQGATLVDLDLGDDNAHGLPAGLYTVMAYQELDADLAEVTVIRSDGTDANLHTLTVHKLAKAVGYWEAQ